jgi:hypothetical protein
VIKFKVGDLVEFVGVNFITTVYGKLGVIVEVNNKVPENHILHLHKVFVDGSEVLALPSELKLIE